MAFEPEDHKLAHKEAAPSPGVPVPGRPPDLHEPADSTDDAAFAVSVEDYEHLIDEYSHFAPPAEGELLQGHVLRVTDKEVIVDFGYKSEGIVPLSEFLLPDGTVTVRPGDAIDVMVDRHGPPVEGYVTLSHEKASRLRSWDTLERAYNEGLLVSGRVLTRIKGGLMVDVGTRAFMPASQVDVRPLQNLDSLIGADIAVKIVKLNRRRGNVVVSRKLAVEEDHVVRKQQALVGIEEGSVVTGTIKNLTDYGAFVDLGGIDGLLHVSDLSYGRVAHPAEMLHVGDEVTVRVLKFEKDKERISLGLKQLQEDPWNTVVERYPGGARVIGKVVSITDYGAFVELEPGVEGLIHITEMTWSRRLKHPSKVVRVGDSVEVVVLEVKPSEKRVSLGIKQLEADPWTTVEDRYSVGSVVEGRVRKLTDFGCFIEIEEGIDGLVHVSDLSWTKRIKHPSEMLKKGQIVQAVILSIDAENRRLSLGIKQLQPNAWETFFSSHKLGDIIRGRVSRISSFGVFVEVAPSVEGLCHNSEIPGTARRDGPALPVGDELDFKIIKLNEGEKRIGLSLRALAEDEERTRLEDYQRQAAAATMTIEEVMQLKGHGEGR